MSGKKILLIALDGVILGPNGIDENARAVVENLQEVGAAVVLYTSRSRAELEPIRKHLGITAPFITESGSAIFTPIGHNPFSAPLGEKDGGYFVDQLGSPYVQARAGLRVIANVISHPLKGFGDFTVTQLQRSQKISEEAAHQAKAREFSEPFMTPKAVDPAMLLEAAEEMGFSVVLRDAEESRFSELLGVGAGLKPATKALLAAYATEYRDEPVRAVGVSDRESEIALLTEAAQEASLDNWQGVVVSAGELTAVVDAIAG